MGTSEERVWRGKPTAPTINYFGRPGPDVAPEAGVALMISRRTIQSSRSDFGSKKKTAEQDGTAREDDMAQRKSLNVNGKAVRITIDDPDMPLLYPLRDNLALRGPRFGCGLAQCGACTVHIDGKAVRSCVTPLSSLSAQQKVVTLEGLGTPQRLHPVQRAFIEEQA